MLICKCDQEWFEWLALFKIVVVLLDQQEEFFWGLWLLGSDT
ncbi:hypothetical protein [Acetobacterium woodii]|nr:hypothetical protein [Acetobacterium woodii]